MRRIPEERSGWHRVEILREVIFDLETIQDIGLQVMNFDGRTEGVVCIDQVEIILRAEDKPAGNR